MEKKKEETVIFKDKRSKINQKKERRERSFIIFRYTKLGSNQVDYIMTGFLHREDEKISAESILVVYEVFKFFWEKKEIGNFACP